MLIKNCIVLVDEIDKRMAEAGESLKVIAEASLSRLRPVMLAAVYFFGVSALLLIAVCTGTCMLLEWLLTGRGNLGNSPVRDGSAAVTGILLALTLPPGLWWLGVHGLWLPLAGVPLALIHGHLYAKYTRWALTPDLLLFHRGWLWRRLAVVPRNRIQAIRLTRSPFDRRYRMSELEVDTAGGGLGKRRVRLPYLDRRVAARLGSALYH